jgi:hypothetical protein
MVRSARDLLKPVLGAAKADKLIAAIMSVEGVPDTRDLRALWAA